MSYKEFSYFYDYFNYNADYDKLFDKIVSLASRQGVKTGIVCDLGCGTGELAFRFDKAGFDVIAVDNSDEMLDVLYDKKDELGADDVLILKQDITQLDMYGTVDLFTCTFDTVNHLEGAGKVQALFDKAKANMESKTETLSTMEEIIASATTKDGFIKTLWCGDEECEKAMKEKAGLTSRCMPFGEQDDIDGVCPVCGKKAKHRVIWGKAY